MVDGTLLSHKEDEIMPFAATWTDPEIIILSEVNWIEKDKHQYSILMHIYGI